MFYNVLVFFLSSVFCFSCFSVLFCRFQKLACKDTAIFSYMQIFFHFSAPPPFSAFIFAFHSTHFFCRIHAVVSTVTLPSHYLNTPCRFREEWHNYQYRQNYLDYQKRLIRQYPFSQLSIIVPSHIYRGVKCKKSITQCALFSKKMHIALTDSTLFLSKSFTNTTSSLTK
jgi:hypothetical protein